MGLEKPIEAAEEATETVKQKSKVLCPWLPDPELCPKCDVYMDAEEEFVGSQAMVVDVWVCGECGYRCYRDEPY